MKKIFKILASVITCFVLAVSFTGCKKDDSGCGNLTLEELNAMLNDSENMDMHKANAVAVVPFDHVNGPKAEWDFYALINFVYRDRAAGYVKYQVTYLSCTCRTMDVNYWQTAYIELTIPSSGNPEEAVLKKLSFDKDIQDADLQEGEYNYITGFWGDSSPIYDEGTHSVIYSTYDKVEVQTGDKYRSPDAQVSTNPNYYLVEEDGKLYYPSIKYDYIPKLVGKTKAELDKYNFSEDLLTEEVLTQREYDMFAGSSVSTNNILRILHSVFDYHADTYF